MSELPKSHHALDLQKRVRVFIGYVVALWLLSGTVLKDWTPFGEPETAWFAAGLGVVVFRLLSSPFFVRPSESLAAAVGAALLLAPLPSPPLEALSALAGLLRWLGLALCVAVAVAASSVMVMKQAKDPSDKRENWQTTLQATYTGLGSGGVLFFAPAFSSFLWTWNDPYVAAALTSAWLALATVEPLERITFVVLVWLDDRKASGEASLVGTIARVDSPSLVRVSLSESATWAENQVYVCRTEHGSQLLVLPLFMHSISSGRIGTGLLIEAEGFLEVELSIRESTVCEWEGCPSRVEVEKHLAGGDLNGLSLVGFVVENSSIEELRFEVVPGTRLEENSVCVTPEEAGLCHYQILDAVTREESFEQNPGGKVIASASQLGFPGKKGGFLRRRWLAPMNTPVFSLTREMPREPPKANNKLFLGYVPGTDYSVFADFGRMLRYHAAVLGVTGSGKTEFVLDTIRHALSEDTHVVAVDFTGEYRPRLSDRKPERLGVPTSTVERVAQLAEKVETGKYGGADEKREFVRYMESLRPSIAKDVDEFLSKGGSRVALFELEEIVNTRATLRITELLISAVFEWARANRRARNILLVLEEAHTIVPELNMFGFDKVDTAAVLGRTAQVALQGRKYGVGLLVVSQRTALVSKTILSQCNTYVCFSMVDRTSLEYMSNVCEKQFAKSIPRLRPLSALVCGVGVESDRPVLVEIPFDEDKKRASERLGVTIESAS